MNDTDKKEMDRLNKIAKEEATTNKEPDGRSKAVVLAKRVGTAALGGVAARGAWEAGRGLVQLARGASRTTEQGARGLIGGGGGGGGVC